MAKKIKTPSPEAAASSIMSYCESIGLNEHQSAFACQWVIAAILKDTDDIMNLAKGCEQFLLDNSTTK